MSCFQKISKNINKYPQISLNVLIKISQISIKILKNLSQLTNMINKSLHCLHFSASYKNDQNEQNGRKTSCQVPKILRAPANFLRNTGASLKNIHAAFFLSNWKEPVPNRFCDWSSSAYKKRSDDPHFPTLSHRWFVNREKSRDICLPNLIR